MITKVVLSERHLISVCSELNHVRTWVVSRFRGMISTQPTSSPLASFQVTSLDQDEPQALLHEVIKIVEKVASKFSNNNAPTTVTTAGAQSGQMEIESAQPIATVGTVRLRNQSSLGRLLAGCGGMFQGGFDSTVENSFEPGSEVSSSREADASLPQMSSDLPRTSWLHEDPGTAASQQSTARASYQSTVGYQPPPIHLQQRIVNHQLLNQVLKAKECKKASGDQMKLKRPLISSHQHSNGIGPFGERDDQLLFIQKLTPLSKDVFIRLASNGKRVCMIKCLDDQPITAFCMQSLDGSNRVATRPQRFILTGHQNGTIQIWDLSTALGSIKPSLMTEDYLTAPALYANNSLHSGAGASGHYTSPGGLSVQHPQTGNFVSAVHRDLASQDLAGPTIHEMLQQLSSCRLAK
ncbi:hypothetical protein Ciccas_004131 [Cichlidogyrus casuarinus]|uniref:Uncharacterized protein n=1 Tax=Cichlidogyrus casuarinus TaxID=1844966 RepID=A0ABD2QCC8_9PLAT